MEVINNNLEKELFEDEKLGHGGACPRIHPPMLQYIDKEGEAKLIVDIDAQLETLICLLENFACFLMNQPDFSLDMLCTLLGLQDELAAGLAGISLSGPFVTQAGFWLHEGGGDNPGDCAPLLNRNSGALSTDGASNADLLKRTAGWAALCGADKIEKVWGTLDMCLPHVFVLKFLLMPRAGLHSTLTCGGAC